MRRSVVSWPSLRWRCSSSMMIRRWCSCEGKTIHIAAVSDMTTYLCAGFRSLASLVLCFSPPEAKVRLEVDETRGVRRLPRRLDWEIEGVVRDVEWWLVTMMSGWWEWDCRLGLEKIFYTLLLMLHLYALRMQITAKLLGLPDPFIFYFPLKLIGDDHGPHTSGGV